MLGNITPEQVWALGLSLVMAALVAGVWITAAVLKYLEWKARRPRPTRRLQGGRGCICGLMPHSDCRRHGFLAR